MGLFFFDGGTVEKEGKHPGGRPTKYDPIYCEQIVEFFSRPKTYTKTVTKHDQYGKFFEVEEELPNDVPFFSEFARLIGVSQQTLHAWKAEHEEFLEAYNTAKDLQKEFLVSNSMQGRYAQSFAIFTAKNILGWRDRVDNLNMEADPDNEDFRNKFFGIDDA